MNGGPNDVNVCGDGFTVSSSFVSDMQRTWMLLRPVNCSSSSNLPVAVKLFTLTCVMFKPCLEDADEQEMQDGGDKRLLP